MERETDREIERNPGQVEERDRTKAREKRPDGVKVAQRLNAVAAVSDDQRQPHDRVVDALAHCLVERVADPHHDAAADQVEDGERPVQAGGER